LNARVNATGEHAPLAGVERSGRRLVYNDTSSQYLRDVEQWGENKITEAGYSIGIRVKDNGELQDVIPGTPAYQAGVAPGMKLIAVNGRRFTSDVLSDALRPTSAAPATVTLLVENQDFFTPYSFTYQGGLREPHLERDASKPDLLGAIIAPRPVSAPTQ
jgi:predicted metalloprotease with PDZ domain